MNMDPKKFVEAMNGDMDCRKCGMCCIVYYQQITNKDIIRHPKLKDVVTPNMSDSKSDFPFILGEPAIDVICPFYNVEIGCKIYETRPDNCRNYKSSPFKCMSAALTNDGLDVKTTIERWSDEGIDGATILSRVYTQYFNYRKKVLSRNTYVYGSKTLEDDLEQDDLISIVHSRTLNCVG